MSDGMDLIYQIIKCVSSINLASRKGKPDENTKYLKKIKSERQFHSFISTTENELSNRQREVIKSLYQGNGRW